MNLGWLVGAAILLAVLGFATHLLVARRGMSRSVGGRTSQFGALLTRSVVRKVTLRFRQLLASRAERARLQQQYHLKTAEEAARTMGQMKGVFMKIGQIMSFTNESLPAEARQALEGLQQDAPPMDFSLVRDVIQQELGKPPEDLFRYIDTEPLAAASIGQVHRATLKDGTDVVLKVQYPGVDEAIRADLKASAGLASMMTAVHKKLDANAIVAELKEIIGQELDYGQELRNQQLFYDLWKDHPLIHVPKVYPEYSAQRVLCQEYRRGLRFADFLEQANEREKQLAVRVLFDFVFDSMYRYHVFNGDPHPGNYLFHEDGGITFLDYGCIKFFEQDFMDNLCELHRALLSSEEQPFEDACRATQLVLPGEDYDFPKIREFMEYNMGHAMKDEPFRFTREWIAKAGENMRPEHVTNINLPKDMVFFNRITFGLNSLFMKLDAEENFYRLNQRYLETEHDHPPALAASGLQLPPRHLTAKPSPAKA